MERLKGQWGRVCPTLQLTFTFQYGEIKSAEHLPRHRLGKKFTFQYGEIKRDANYRIRMHTVTFTFQYGEIKSICVLEL